MSSILLIGLLLGTQANHLAPNRTHERLSAAPTTALAEAARLWGDRQLILAETSIDADRLRRLARPPPGEPVLRWVREELGRPIDLPDFVLFLDDILATPAPLPKVLHLPASRGRAHGILLHPQEVFRSRPRDYGHLSPLPLTAPPPTPRLKPAHDHDPPGPQWTARYPQRPTEQGKLEALIRANPPFGRAMKQLLMQLKRQGTFTRIESGVRPRERGFLIYGSWLLSHARSEAELTANIAALDRYERAWGLHIPIRWQHPGGFRRTLRAVRMMVDTYGVDHATLRGAKNSNHYGGRAIDVVAVNLPRTLHLLAPDGARRTFNLSHPSASRDLSLSPRLIAWIEQHFHFRKLRLDYPHWDDIRSPPKR